LRTLSTSNLENQEAERMTLISLNNNLLTAQEEKETEVAMEAG